MAVFENTIIKKSTPPLMGTTNIPAESLKNRFGDEMGNNMIEQTQAKALSEAAADRLNQKLTDDWDAIRKALNAVMLPYDVLHHAMQAAGCQITATDLELDKEFYCEAVRNARFIRDRFSMLDLIDDSIGLESVVQTIPS